MAEVAVTLSERGARYGAFNRHAEITQDLKRAIFASPNWEDNLTDSMREALEMIVHKIGRILNGDPFYIDSWHDIIGYAQLIENELIADEATAVDAVKHTNGCFDQLLEVIRSEVRDARQA